MFVLTNKHECEVITQNKFAQLFQYILLLLFFFLMEIYKAAPFLLEILLDIDGTSAVYTCIIEMGWRERKR